MMIGQNNPRETEFFFVVLKKNMNRKNRCKENFVIIVIKRCFRERRW